MNKSIYIVWPLVLFLGIYSAVISWKGGMNLNVLPQMIAYCTWAPVIFAFIYTFISKRYVAAKTITMICFSTSFLAGITFQVYLTPDAFSDQPFGSGAMIYISLPPLFLGAIIVGLVCGGIYLVCRKYL